MTYFEYPVIYFKYPVASFDYPVAYFEYPVAYFEYPVACFDYPVAYSDSQQPSGDFDTVTNLITRLFGTRIFDYTVMWLKHLYYQM